MKALLQARSLCWKKQWKGLFLWLLFPLLITIIMMIIVSSLQAETKIPIGIVLEDDSILAEQLYESIEETNYIRPVLLSERDALTQLEKQQLDSVFIISKQYEQSIERSRQHNLIQGYESDFSFAYTPVKELVLSYVYEDFTRSRATFVVKDLYDQFKYEGTWDWYELVNRSKQIEDEQDLLRTTLSFGESTDQEEQSINLLDPWNVWVLMTLFATLMLFDWVIKENKLTLHYRLRFSRYPLKLYLFINGLIYTAILLIVDFIVIFILASLYSLSLSGVLIFTIISYRVTLNIFVFLFSLIFKEVYSFYVMSFLLFCLVIIGSGALIPLDGLTLRFPMYTYLNPLESFLSISIANHWSVIALILLIIWLIRKETYNA